MIKYLFLFLAAALLGACGNNKADQPETEKDTLSTQTFTRWEATLNDSTGQLVMKKNQGPGPDSLTVASILRYLNGAYPNVQLVFVKSSNDTVYLDIPNATYLTQQMGSTGPTLYFSEVVYNLTELTSIKHVHFDFEEGDHASPATLNRDSFNDN